MGVRAAQKSLAMLCIGSDRRRLLRSGCCLPWPHRVRSVINSIPAALLNRTAPSFAPAWLKRGIDNGQSQVIYKNQKIKGN